MKPPQIVALTRDALHQVLDNWVFRILGVLVLLPIACAFVFGLRKEGIVLLFGLKTWDYESLMRGFNYHGPMENLREAFIEGLLGFVFSILAGGIGVMFCIAATAFFVPQMIEKGAADILFHKPVSRLGFFLSRYVAGLLFVGILSTILVVGLFLDLWLVSGHFDLGILWAAPALTYAFALVYSVSLVIGVWTRSTVAATLLTVLFFLLNGCIHNTWISFGETRALFGGGESSEQEGEPEPPGFWTRALDQAHYALPKTTDADYIAQKLRRTVSGPPFSDEDTLFSVKELPEGLRVAHGSPPAGTPSIAALRGETRWLLESEDGQTIEIWRRPQRITQEERNGKVRDREESARMLADELEGLLEADAGVSDVVNSSLPTAPPSDGADGGDAGGAAGEALVLAFSNRSITWKEGDTQVRLVLFRRSEFLYGIEQRALSGTSTQLLGQLLQECEFESEAGRWYGRQLGWTAPLKYNIFFSIGSSLLFVAVMLALGWWKLGRIDF